MNFHDLWKKNKKWFSISVMALPLALLPAIAAFATTNELGQHHAQSTATKSVYHVYIGDHSIGTVDDPSVVTTLVNQAITKAQSEHPGTSFVVDPSVSTVMKHTVNPSFNDQAVTSTLEKKMKVVPAAIKIIVGGQPVATVKDQAAAKQAIETFAQQFVPVNEAKKVVNTVQTSSKTSVNQRVSKSGNYTILDASSGPMSVSLKQNVTFEKVPANTASLSTIHTVVQRLTKGDLVKDTYTVKQGDTLGSIAVNFNLSTKDLLNLNPKLNETSLLSIGEKVVVKKPEAYLDLQQKKKVTTTETISHAKKIEETSNLYKGQARTLQKGQDGKQSVTYQETVTNGVITTKNALSRTVLSAPTTEIIEEGTKVISSRGTGVFQWPAEGGVITSPFGPRWGEFHKGIDIAGVSNRTIMAADNGVITYAQWNNGGYGNRIIINHNNGFETTYNHLAQIDVHVGQVVRKGEAIGVMGETGDATGIHLHFEVYKNGQLENPSNYVHR